jgi:hypothetical protein
MVQMYAPHHVGSIQALSVHSAAVFDSMYNMHDATGRANLSGARVHLNSQHIYPVDMDYPASSIAQAIKPSDSTGHTCGCVVLLSYGLLPYNGSSPYAGSGVWSFVLTFINIRYLIYVHVTLHPT